MGSATATRAADQFDAILGRTRGAGRPDCEDPEVIGSARRRRHLLALIAAHGILDHNSVVSMPDSFSAGKIATLVEHGGRPDLPAEMPASDDLLEDLRVLTSARLLRRRDNDQWYVTPTGLVEFWTGSSQLA